ncbi:helix-turn-helix domain-containing protein [Paenibacillus sp. MBLB4367]|uniref:helix-turn-helix domain-containing protein n=1 Tax=Paenibacillus sp. MBLB4367 TaxID=3384767 RepID=UPI003907EB5C
MEAKDFGRYLKRLRENAGLSMGQLSRLAKLSQPYISQIESGQRGIPSPETLKKLAQHLGKTHAELMVEAGHFNIYDWILTPEEEAELAKKERADAYSIENAENERKQLDYELTDILQNNNITYHGHPLTDDDRRRILDMLAVLFPDRK